jgi:chloramphenicol 3-O phosphotransferase
VAGRVLFLNGSSSAGKTTLVFSLQSVLTESWVSVGVDQWTISAPLRLFGSEEGHRFVEGPRIETGPEFRRIHRAWHRATTTLLDEGINVIVDEVLLDPELRDDWVEVLRPYDTTWVKVWCDPEVCEERAARRGDRALGMARVQAGYVHDGVRYDTEVDTTSTDSFLLAQQLKAVLEP